MKTGERQVAPNVEGIRRDHVARYEFAASLLPKGSAVVDVACGVGYGSAILADKGCDVLGIDYHAEALAYARAHYARGTTYFAEQDAARLDLCDWKFDAAVCFETIEHLEDPRPMLRELRRAARKLIASVPNEDCFPYNGYKFHFRHYTPDEFEALLNETGWQITSWAGQVGPNSEVDPDVEGRTIVVVAKRAKKPKKLGRGEFDDVAGGEVVSPAVHTSERHVAILGLGPSLGYYLSFAKKAGGPKAWADEVWGINQAGLVLACDRMFHMDDMLVQQARAQELGPNSNIYQMVEALKVDPGIPVYTSIVRPGFDYMTPFPLEEVLRKGGYLYFNNSAPYALALARHEGFDKVSIFGCDYTMPNIHSAESGRGCTEFWCGMLAASNIEVALPPITSLLDALVPDRESVYGYDMVDLVVEPDADGLPKVSFVPRDNPPTPAEIEARYGYHKHPNRMVSGYKAEGGDDVQAATGDGADRNAG